MKTTDWAVLLGFALFIVPVMIILWGAAVDVLRGKS
jgi:hypothetical protein